MTLNLKKYKHILQSSSNHPSSIIQPSIIHIFICNFPAFPTPPSYALSPWNAPWDVQQHCCSALQRTLPPSRSLCDAWDVPILVTSCWVAFRYRGKVVFVCCLNFLLFVHWLFSFLGRPIFVMWVASRKETRPVWKKNAIIFQKNAQASVQQHFWCSSHITVILWPLSARTSQGWEDWSKHRKTADPDLSILQVWLLGVSDKLPHLSRKGRRPPGHPYSRHPASSHNLFVHGQVDILADWS